MRSVVDEHVDPAERLHRFIDQRPAMRRLRDIARHQQALLSGFRYQPSRLLGVPVLIEIRDEQIGALAREGERDGAANSGIPAR